MFAAHVQRFTLNVPPQLESFLGDSPDTVPCENVTVAVQEGDRLVAASFLDFETSDYLVFKVYEDGTDPTTVSELIHFTAPTANDKFFNDVATNPNNPTKLGLRFQDVTYNIPAGLTKLVVRVEALTTWWNEIVGFDNIRITAGATALPPHLSSSALSNGRITIQWINGGTLESSPGLSNPVWTSTLNSSGSFTESLPATGNKFYRVKQ